MRRHGAAPLILAVLALCAVFFSGCEKKEREKNFVPDLDFIAFEKAFEDSHTETENVFFKNEKMSEYTTLIRYPSLSESEIKAKMDSLELKDGESASMNGNVIVVKHSASKGSPYGNYLDELYGKSKDDVSSFFLGKGYKEVNIEFDIN